MGETCGSAGWCGDATPSGAAVAIGQHTNVCIGRPCADLSLVPSLFGSNGCFKSSKVYRQSIKQGVDFVDFDEVVIEIEAQYARFKELVGTGPDYFEVHAVTSKKLTRAISFVAGEHHLKEQLLSFDPAGVVVCGSTEAHVACEDLLPPERYDPRGFVRRVVEGIFGSDTYVLIFHSGYLDDFILSHSSLTVNRIKDVDALIDPQLRQWLLQEQDDLCLVSYRNL
ncbi:MAG: ChbG/HpnK family deacetylase [Olegusella sp.]|nr:ChbG/HpnK family deacetylase [Olegusella sp.]